jgi:hypothetical protein
MHDYDQPYIHRGTTPPPQLKNVASQVSYSAGMYELRYSKAMPRQIASHTYIKYPELFSQPQARYQPINETEPG